MITSAEAAFFAPDMPRVAGLEREYGIHIINAATQQPSDVSSVHIQTEIRQTPGIDWTRQFSGIGRTYVDVGNHIEHATNEFKDLPQLALAQIGGDLIVLGGLQRHLRQREEELGLPAEEAVVSLRSSDDIGNYWAGVHVNMSMARTAFDKLFRDGWEPLYATGNDAMNQLASYIVSSSLVIGNGALVEQQDGVYAIHPFEKLHASHYLVSPNTTSARPIVNYRDEPHSPLELFSRLHIISLDTHTRPATTAVQLGCLSAFLRVFEHDLTPPMWFANPLQALKGVKANPDAKQEVTSADGSTKQMNGAELFAITVEWLSNKAEEMDFPNQEKAALRIAANGVAAFIDGAPTSKQAIALMPWVTKRNTLREAGLLERTLRFEERDMLRAQNRTFDTYLIRKDAIVAGSHLASIHTERVKEAALEAAMTPPKDTRAHQRAQFIASIPEPQRLDAQIDWTMGRYYHPGKGESVHRAWRYPTAKAS